MVSKESVQLAWVQHPSEFPPTNNALAQPNGLLAAGEAIDADWLTAAYQRGIFPWYSAGEPVLWWTPSPRAVLFTEHFKSSRSLRKTLRQHAQDPNRCITLNRAFEEVMRACSAPRAGQNGTWITESITQAYCDLHRQGLAHSVEHWFKGELVGGLYCVALGKMVYGESMFSRQTDASKIAFAHFVAWLKAQGVHIIDCQQATRHLMSFGATVVPRASFEEQMRQAQAQPALNWQATTLSAWHDES